EQRRLQPRHAAQALPRGARAARRVGPAARPGGAPGGDAMRPSPPLKLKPASTAREVQIAAVALKAGYLSAYRVVRDEPRWVGHKEPAWVPCRSSHYEVRLYEHVADRAYQV